MANTTEEMDTTTTQEETTTTTNGGGDAEDDTTTSTNNSSAAPAPRKRKRRGFSNADLTGSVSATTNFTKIEEVVAAVPVAIGTLLPGGLLPTPPVVNAPVPIVASVTSTTSSLPELSDALKAKLQTVKSYAVAQTVEYRNKLDMLKAEQARSMAEQGELAAKQKAYVIMCRVYVGSLYYSTTADSVKGVFGQFGTIKAIDLPWDPATGAHKGYCFVEYDCPEAAQMSLAEMNGQILDGRPIKCGRPNAAPQAQPVIDAMKNDPINTTRIYVANIHAELGESDIKSVFESFGTVASCKLCPDPQNPGKHKSFGFIEYELDTSAKEAVESMNAFDLGGQFLRVCPAITLPEYCPFLTNAGANVNAANMAAANATAGLTATGEPLVDDGDGEDKKDSDDEDMLINGTSQRFMMMQKLAEKEKESTVVLLKDMVEKEDIDDDLEGEVSEECQKCGKVAKVVIYEEFVEIENFTAVKIFVKFEDPESAAKCVTLMNGRWFGGKQIIGEVYDEALFTAQDYTG